MSSRKSSESVVLFTDGIHMADPQSEEKIRIAIGFIDSNEITKKRRQETFIALLSLTKHSLQNSPEIEIEISELAKEMGISTNNYDDIRERLRDLMRTIVDWNRHGTDRNKGWIDSQVLGPTEFDGAIVRTTFQKPVWEKIKDPIVYTYLTKGTAYRLKSKHAKSLNNFFTRMLKNLTTVVVQTELEDVLFDILCLDEDSSATYKSFRRLNEKILSKQIPKINKESLFTVTYEGIREGRKVTKIQWVIKRKSSIEKTERLNKNVSSEKTAITAPSTNLVVKEALAEIRFSWHSKAVEKHTVLKETLSEDTLNAYLLFLAQKARKQELKNREEGLPEEDNNPGGFFFNMLKTDSQLEIFKKSQEKTQKKEQRQHQEKKDLQQAELEKRLKAIHKENQNNRLKAFVLNEIKTNEGERLLLESLQGNFMFQKSLKSAGSIEAVLNNNFHRGTLAAAIYQSTSFEEEVFNKEEWLNSPKYEQERLGVLKALEIN